MGAHAAKAIQVLVCLALFAGCKVFDVSDKDKTNAGVKILQNIDGVDGVWDAAAENLAIVALLEYKDGEWKFRIRIKTSLFPSDQTWLEQHNDPFYDPFGIPPHYPVRNAGDAP